MKSADFSCIGVPFELLCEQLSPQKVIEKIIGHDLHPPIRVYWDSFEEGGWYSLVMDRIGSFKTVASRSPPKKRGKLLYGNFPLNKKRE
jgi:hypothetical protein